MEGKTVDVKGTGYVIEGLDSRFPDPSSVEATEFEDGDTNYVVRNAVYGKGDIHTFENGCIRSVFTDVEDDKLAYNTVNGSRYTVHHWSSDMQKGLIEGNQGLMWIYDAEEDITAYFDGDSYVAAFNPDIAHAWEELLDGKWMEELSEDTGTLHGLNRLHPEIRERVMRGLSTD